MSTPFLRKIGRMILFAAIGFVIAATAHVISMRQLGSEWEHITQVHHTRQVTVPLPYDEAFELCVQSIEPIPKSEVTRIDQANGRIEATTSITWRSLGETVIFTLNPIDGHSTKVTVSSKPTVRTTRLDYGKNLENIQTIERVLSTAALK